MIKNFFKKLPLKTILVASFLAISLILFIGAYSKKGAFSKINILGVKETTIESQEKDSDNDGLKDWEEDIYGTDPLNSDTDNDGFLDGEEVSSGHNPLVKAPGDKQVFYPLPLGESYNVTSKLFADIETILEAYLIQKSEYLNDHPEITSPEDYLTQTYADTFNEMFKRAILYNEKDWLQQAEVVLSEMPELFKVEVSDNDIYISENNDIENIKKYTEKLLNYLNSESFFLQERNFVLLRDQLPQNNFTKINNLIKFNDSEIKRLREVNVPSTWKEVHKKALKISIISRNIFISFRGYESDPIKTLVAANEIKNVLKEWEILINEFNNISQLQGLNLSL